MIGINRKDTFIHRTECRICGNKNLYKFLSLGHTPLVNSFLRKDQLDKIEPYYPLDVYICNNCYLVQLLDVVFPDVIFKDYVYVTGTSKPMKIHFEGLAKDIFQNFKINKNSLVVDIGSNDGTLLQSFLEYDYQVLGVEPASNISKLAKDRGIRTINDFFSEKCATKIYEEYGKADIITATNVFAHIDNLQDILQGINCLLTDDGIFIIEVPYLLNLLNNSEFDTIYHEHLSYFSIYPLIYLVKKFGLEIVNIEQLSIHGGTIRVFIQKLSGKQSQNVIDMLATERNSGLYSLDIYNKFSRHTISIKERLVKLLDTLKNDGARITGYGAAAKGNILLNYCKIGTNILDYISDTTPFKQGLYTPGMHIPVVSEEIFHKDFPDYVLLLAWNYTNDILKKETKYIQNGGKFIIPVPEPRIVQK